MTMDINTVGVAIGDEGPRADSYDPRAIKKRRRRTKAEMVEISEAIIEVLQEDNPQTLRHVFYRLCGAPYNLVPKEGKYSSHSCTRDVS